MMRPFSLRWLIPFSLVVLLLPACSDDAGDSPGTTLAPTTAASETTTTAASENTTTAASENTTTTAPPTTTTVPATTTTEAATTTTVDPARLPDPVAMERLVRDYCSQWPDVAGFLAEDVALVDVSADGWVAPGPSEMLCYVQEVDEGIVLGRSDVAAALDATGYSNIDCGGPSVISGDWIAVPVSASRSDGTGEEGIWVLRIVDDEIGWQLNYATDTTQVSPAATGPDPVLETETRSYCALYEGTGYDRSAPDVLAAMTDDPAIQHIPVSLHCMGVSGIKTDVDSYVRDDIIGCGAVTTNGQWSAQASTIEHPPANLGLVGILVRQHIDGKIHRQYNQYTQTSGTGNWGFHLDDE
jgi:hypothetical protein